MKSGDREWMERALREARRGARAEEVPIGALAVLDGEVVAAAHNRSLTSADPTAHAEVLVLRRAGRKLGSHRLTEVSIYVTLEPCLMCAGAIVNARIPRVVFGAHDPRAGACGSLYQVGLDTRLNHRFDVVGGVLAQECAALLQEFFGRKRGPAG